MSYMSSIISLPKLILSPTVADLFRGCEDGLPPLAGKFNVDERKLFPRGEDKRKAKIKLLPRGEKENKQELTYQLLICSVLFSEHFTETAEG